MAGIRMAKATQDDMEVLIRFFNLYEAVCEKTSDFRQSDLDEWDEEDEDRKHLQRFIIKKEDKWARGSVGEFDYIAFFEHWIAKIAPRWRRVVFGCDMLIEAMCDPHERHLAFSPYLNEQHVAPEQ